MHEGLGLLLSTELLNVFLFLCVCMHTHVAYMYVLCVLACSFMNDPNNLWEEKNMLAAIPEEQKMDVWKLFKWVL